MLLHCGLCLVRSLIRLIQHGGKFVKDMETFSYNTLYHRIFKCWQGVGHKHLFDLFYHKYSTMQWGEEKSFTHLKVGSEIFHTFKEDHEFFNITEYFKLPLTHNCWQLPKQILICLAICVSSLQLSKYDNNNKCYISQEI